MLHRRPREPVSELPLDEIDFLLGVVRPSAEILRLEKTIGYRPIYCYLADMMPPSEFRARFERHRPFLAAEARRRGIALPDPAEFGPQLPGDGGKAFWPWRQTAKRNGNDGPAAA